MVENNPIKAIVQNGTAKNANPGNKDEL